MRWKSQNAGKIEINLNLTSKIFCHPFQFSTKPKLNSLSYKFLTRPGESKSEFCCMVFSSYDHFFSFLTKHTKKSRRKNCVCCSLNEINITEKTREREANEQKRTGKRRKKFCWSVHGIFKLPVIREWKMQFGQFKGLTKNERFKRLFSRKIEDENVENETEKWFCKILKSFIDETSLTHKTRLRWTTVNQILISWVESFERAKAKISWDCLRRRFFVEKVKFTNFFFFIGQK